MRLSQTLAFKVIGIGCAFLVLALGSIALTLWVTWQLEGGAAAVNEAGRMRMMTWRMAYEAAQGDRPLLQARAATMDATLALLRDGDPSRPLFIPWDADARSSFDAVQGAWPALRERWLAGASPPPVAMVADYVRSIDRFVSAIEERLSHWTAVLRAVQLTMLALAVASAVVLLYALHLMVLDPLRRLGQGMDTLRRGEFAARVQVGSRDEFGDLAAGFNAMAERLQALYAELEHKVREKTARLEVKRERLAALYEVSAFVGRADTLDELADGFATQIRRIAGADAVAVRWSDASNERYLLLAQDGLPAELRDSEQCLTSRTCRCGQPAQGPAARVLPIRADDGGLPHCAQAGFRTVVTLPVVLHQRVLGEVDLFFRAPRSVDDEERALFEALATHLAGAMEALHAAAAEKEAAVAGERTLLARELHDSIAQALAFLKIQVGLLREAVRRNDAQAVGHAIDEIDEGVRESYGDVRELLLHFRTRTNVEDIEAALRTTAQKFEHQSGVPIALEVRGHGVPLQPDTQVQVLHVLQEALSNVRKHAQARHVRLTVEAAPHWRFEVADDGRGFDPRARHAATHVGLRIMRERAARIGAQLVVRSAPGAGTSVVLTVPRGTVVSEEHEDEHARPVAGR
jgi:two-component system nitrate/nitrite sensor histidine kinase NarX